MVLSLVRACRGWGGGAAAGRDDVLAARFAPFLEGRQGPHLATIKIETRVAQQRREPPPGLAEPSPRQAGQSRQLQFGAARGLQEPHFGGHLVGQRLVDAQIQNPLPALARSESQLEARSSRGQGFAADESLARQEAAIVGRESRREPRRFAGFFRRGSHRRTRSFVSPESP
ncbi:MAG: hypothetical protein GX621_00895 [Pirellulaceae bacterium]|nr:hypothetical protein [Pirellulaceae bacterium]